MRKIYTGIDIGSNSIKIVVSEFFNNKFHVLASTSVKSHGVHRGIITDVDKVSVSLKEALKKIESTIGLKIEEAVLTIPSNNRKLSVVSGNVDIGSDVVTGTDISNVLNNSVIDMVDIDYELITVIPIMFSVDEDTNITDPKGITGEKLGVKAVMVTVPKENITNILKTCKICKIEIKDIVFKSIGDYYEARGKDTDKELGAIINVGYETIDISIFNKGIIIKNDIINLGSKNIDKDISYMYGIDLNIAEDLKENFSVCSRKYADVNDIIDIKINEEEKISINQYELSEVVEARVTELLKLAKNSINNLTNRKISYIIVTGGITELMGFGYLVENVLGINASTLNITSVGIRGNKYSSAIGIIKYFYEKLKLRGIDYTMFDESKTNLSLMSNKKNLLNVNNDTIVSKIFGYFTNN